MTKSIEELTKEVEERVKFSTRDNYGFSGTYLEKIVPSTKQTAIAYQTGGSNWNYSGPNGGGIAKFQGTSVYNGIVDLCVKPHTQWRSSTSASMDDPGNRYSINKFEDLNDGRYLLEISNCYGSEDLIVDFEQREVYDDLEERD